MPRLPHKASSAPRPRTSKSLRQRLILNAGSNWASLTVNALVAFILVPLILKDLGVTGYGVWVLLAYGLGYAAILDSAFALAINRFSALHHANQQQLNRFVSTSFAILASLGAATILVAVLVSFVVADLFDSIPPDLSRDAQTCCILVGLTFAVRMLEANFSGALRGFEYYGRTNVVLMSGTLLRAFLTVFGLLFWKSIVVVQSAYVIAAAASACAMYVLSKRSIAGLRVDFRLIDMATLRELLRYAGHSIARLGSRIIMESTLTLLVGWAGAASDVAVYNIATRLPGMVRQLLIGIQSVFLPTFTAMFATGQIDRIRSVVKTGTRICSAIALASLVLLFAFTEQLLHLWLGSAVPAHTGTVMRILIVSIIPAGLFEIWLPVLVAIGHLRALTLAAIAVAVATITLELIFLQTGTLPPLAPAIALAFTFWIRTGIWLPLYGARKLNIALSQYLRESLTPPLAACCISIMLLSALATVPLIHQLGWITKALASAAIVAASFSTVALRHEAACVALAFKHRMAAQRRPT